MAYQIWIIESISCLGMCKDSAGHQALRANSYRVELSAGAERLNVEVAVTHVASRYAMDCLCGDSAAMKPTWKRLSGTWSAASSTRNSGM